MEAGTFCVLLTAELPGLSPVPGTQKELNKCLLGSVNEPGGTSLRLPDSTDHVAVTRAKAETQVSFSIKEDDTVAKKWKKPSPSLTGG